MVQGQAGGVLHTMAAVLLAYQADLLKDLDKGRGLSPEVVEKLRHTTELALPATRKTAVALAEAHRQDQISSIANHAHPLSRSRQQTSLM